MTAVKTAKNREKQPKTAKNRVGSLCPLRSVCQKLASCLGRVAPPGNFESNVARCLVFSIEKRWSVHYAYIRVCEGFVIAGFLVIRHLVERIEDRGSKRGGGNKYR